MMVKLSKQEQQIIDYMQKHEGITNLDGMIKLGIGRTQARISDLRKKGIPINTVMVKEFDEKGKQIKTYARYELLSEEDFT